MFFKLLKLKYLNNFTINNQHLKTFVIKKNGKIIFKSGSFEKLNLNINSIFDFHNINKNFWYYIIKKYSNNEIFPIDLFYNKKTYKCIVRKIHSIINFYLFTIYNISENQEYTNKILFLNSDKSDKYLIDDNLLYALPPNNINELLSHIKSLKEQKSSCSLNNIIFYKTGSFVVKFKIYFYENIFIADILTILNDFDSFNYFYNLSKNVFFLTYDIQNNDLINYNNSINIDEIIIKENLRLKEYLKDIIHNECLNKDYLLLKEKKLKINNLDKFFNIEIIRNNNYFLIIFQDITQNILSKQKTLDIIDNLPLLVAKLNSNHKITFVNNEYCDKFNVTKNEILNSKFVPIINEDDKITTFRSLKKLLTSPYETKFKNRVLTANGWKTINWYYKKIKNNDQDEIIIIGEDITEKTIYEERLKKLENTFNLIFNNSNYGIIICDKHLQIIDSNSFTESILNKNKEEIIGKIFTTIFNINKIKLELFLKSSNLKNQTIENYLTFYNGTQEMILEISVNKLTDNLIQFLIFDITEKIRQEQKIKEENEKYYELFNVSIDSIFIMKDDKIIDCNPASENIFGGTKEQIIGKTPYDLSPEFQPDGRKSVEKAKELINLALLGISQRFEWMHQRLDKTKFFAEISLQRFYFNNEVYLHAILRDITEEKKLREETIIKEKIIDRSNKMLQLILNTIPIRVYWKNKNLRFDGCNKLFARDIGFENENDIINKTNEDLNINILSPIFDDDEKVINNKIPIINKELKIECNREIVFLKINKIPLIENDEIIGILGTYEDITHIKISELTLKETQEKFYNVFKYINDAIVIFDINFNIIETNNKLLQISEYSFDEIRNLKFEYLFEFSHREKFKIWINNLLNLEENKNNIVEINLKSKSGKLLPVELNGNIFEINNKQKYFICIIRDITERKNFENEIINAILKTEEKEREKFSKNLHDDLGPILSSIKMYINSLEFSKEEEKQKFIIQQLKDLIKESIDTIKEIANDLSPHILTNYGLNAAIENFIKKVEKHIKILYNSNIGEKRFNNDIEISVYRILKELINNTLKHSEASEIEIKIIDKKKKLIINYSDNGIGFDKKNLKGTLSKGMGISNIISRVKTLNGSYEIITELNKGFKFFIEIPI